MKTLKSIFTIITIPLFMASFSQCGSAQDLKLEKKAPLAIKEGQAYCQQWVAGIKGGGAGYQLFIPVAEESKFTLEAAFFRGLKTTNLYFKKAGEGYLLTAHFDDGSNSERDLILHEDPKKEVGNQPPKIKEEMPFKMAVDECVISYKEDGATKYFKVEGIVQREMQSYPMAPKGSDEQKLKQ
ncbi:hypothetical protein ACFQ1M_12795 [Sungkyunkwania multivorans]|uniref:Lipoprotein n=1 Tax=Sungkyunkwania multivorans TaxID=1173618 RepID=A0ABW3D203_9FLAO